MSLAKISPDYLFARALPILFGYTGALCLGYFVLAALAGGVPFIAHPVSLAIEALGALEILWYLLWFLPYRNFLQKRYYLPSSPSSSSSSSAAAAPPPFPSRTRGAGGAGGGVGGGEDDYDAKREQRREAFYNALDHTPDLDDFLRGWMNRAHAEDVRRDNIKEWLLWWLFDRGGGDGDGANGNRNGNGNEEDDGRFGDDDAELEEYVWELERALGVAFRPGRGLDTKPLRPGVDPVEMSHRSLVYYALVGTLDFVTTTYLLLLGFSFYRQGFRSGFFATFPPRPLPLALTPNVSAARGLSYFYRRHTSPNHRPVVFLHGAGVGLAAYLPFLSNIPKEIGVIAIEILPLSNRVTIPSLSSSSLLLSEKPKPRAPTAPGGLGGLAEADGAQAGEKVLADEFERILDQHGADFDDFVLVAHSFGSLLLAPLLARPRTSQRVDSVVLIDPVALLCHLPDAAYNFLRRAPTTASEWTVWWLAARDPSVAHTLARRWWAGAGNWRATPLWREQLAGKRTTVILGSEDDIIPAKAIASYVFYGDVNFQEQTEQRVAEWRMSSQRWTGVRQMELLYMEGLNHGQAFLLSNWLPTIQHVVDMYCFRDKVVSATLQKLREMV